MHNEKIKGIAVCNPVDIDKDYLLFTVEYAAKMGFNHMQIVGPIHDAVKGNIDGMTMYRKYSMFNDEKDLAYVKHAVESVNEACVKTTACGIKTYVWHHELELPAAFKEVYPEVLNSCGDIEVTHPLVKDFLEHKIIDFFYVYPKVDGIILTLHETKIPLLKLKDQKLGKIERVKYVTKILFDICQKLGKELVVRPFASLEEDYVMMAKAYEEISTELLVMDKWTQFDWSLTMPHNAFYHKIKNNPLFVEGDIFGEFFGKGRLPLMLKEHIAGKFDYCEGFSPRGYVARIDRAGLDPFGDVNEVNIHIMHAHLNRKDVEKEIDAFFQEKYPDAWAEVRALMEQTEGVLKKIFYAKGYYFTELSLFPTLNHCKNHYYFEMMRENCDIASNEWYIPRGWQRGKLEGLLEEKESAADEAVELLARLTELKDRLAQDEYDKLWVKFCNLKLVAEIWLLLTRIFMDYAKYFETREDKYAATLEEHITKLLEVNRYGAELLGDKFYLLSISEYFTSGGSIEAFAEEIRESFQLEREAVKRIEKDGTDCSDKKELLDYVICGGAMEGHRLQKEVNFSDTLVRDEALCRIPGNKRGMEWSSINAHGWFSYELKVKPLTEHEIHVVMGSIGEMLEVRVTIGEKEYEIREKVCGRKELIFPYTAGEGCNTVRIRFDKISGYTPCVFVIKLKMRKYIFGVDIGGTTCKLGLFDHAGNLLDKWEIFSEKSDQGRMVLKNVAASLRAKLCEKNISEDNVLGIGMGLPGTRDRAGFFDCPNLNWKHVAAEQEMREIMGGMEVKALNDANAAALGEMWKGSAKGYQDVVMVTLGTGVGGGIIIGGKILEGVHGAAGEIGGIVVNPQETESFIAGPKGCLEQYASATGLVNMTNKRLAQPHDCSVLDTMKQMTAKAVFDACKSGDKLATEIINTFCEILGKGLARVSYVVDPEIYVIGGGVSKAGEMLLEAVQAAFLKDVPDTCGDTEFALASLGNDAGMYGAVYAITEALENGTGGNTV